jgi:hypothetical protein
MLTHHLASSPPWPPRYASPVVENSDPSSLPWYASPVIENSDPSVEDFDGPGVDNEVFCLSQMTIKNLTDFI